jgi:hypothetical protein
LLQHVDDLLGNNRINVHLLRSFSAPASALAARRLVCKTRTFLSPSRSSPRTRVRGRKGTDAEHSAATNERAGAMQRRCDKRSVPE